jgi:Subtilase family
MSEGLQFNRLLVRSLTVAVALISLLPALAGAVVPGPKRHGPLAPALQKLSEPAIAAKSPAQQAAALGLPAEGPGSLIREGRRVLVDVRFNGGAMAQLDALREAEAKIVAASRRYQMVTAAVRPAALRELATVAGVGSVSPVPAPIVYANECEGGSVISEGVAQINAKAAREAFGPDGEGVTVGVLSDSYDRDGGATTNAAEDVETADLPGLANPCLEQKTPVDVRQELSPGGEGTDEGRAMLQIVHDVAPAANLAFASAFFGELAFAESIEELAAPVFEGGAGAKVIVDDVTYPEEPFFQDGPIAAAINKVTGEGVTYLSAAGNDNLIDASGRDIASWEAPGFRDAGSCPSVVQGLPGFNGTHCMDFVPGSGIDTTFGITVNAGATLRVGLQWAEPWSGVGTDIDAFLLDAGGATILERASEENVTDTQRPAELLIWKNSSGSAQTVQFVLNRYSGGNPRLKFILMQNGGGVSATEYPTSMGGDEVGPSVFGHAGSAGAVAVGAVPFNDSSEPERYSSRGPVLHLFGEVNGVTPAPQLPPQVIPKPDLVATDCGATTFFAFFAAGAWRFCGTSAAAPHAAGAAALMVQAGEVVGGGLDEPEPIRAALQQSASPVGGFGACAVGAGLVETRGAIEALLAGPGPLAPLPCAPPPSTLVEEPAPPPVPPATPAPPATPVAVAPNTKILKHPRKVVRTRSRSALVVFRFGANQTRVTFLCKLDRESFKACGARLVRRLPLGGHVLRVKARGAGGLLDRTPAVFRFRIVRL